MVRLSFVGLMLAAAVWATSAEAANGRRSVMRFEPGVVVDATGFDRPMAAASLFVPYGWQVSGGVLWGSEFLCTNGYNFQWSAVAPDGSAGILLLPQMKWENSDYGAGASTPGCGSAPFASARDYILALAGQTFPGARVLDYRDRPDIVQEVGAAPTETPMPLGFIRTWTEAGEALVAFQTQGRDMRASVAAAVQFNLTVTDMSGMYANDPAAMMGLPPVGPTRMQAVTGFAHPGWAAFAPAGQLDLAFFEQLRRSIEPNAAWTRAITGHNVEIGRVAIEESRKRAKIVMETHAEISRIQQETWAMRQASADRQLREFGEAIKGVETYADPNAATGQVELSSNYRGAWRLDDGSYVLSDDVNFDPWRDLQISGTKLEAIQ
jgi:hypothetical protein